MAIYIVFFIVFFILGVVVETYMHKNKKDKV